MKIRCLINKQNDDGLHFRNELKYVCSEQQLAIIKARICNICKVDAHASDDGIYQIRSVYFDDAKDSCYYENENGTDPREKFRIRIYNLDDSRIVLECKRKEHSMTHKDSCLLTKEQCMSILAGTFKLNSTDNALLSKFYLKYARQGFRPKVIVNYEREPFVYDSGNVRITFDRNISSSSKVSDFFEADLPLRPIMPTGYHILEVKYDEFFPDFLYRVMNIGSLKQTAFSKYYLCRKYTI